MMLFRQAQIMRTTLTLDDDVAALVQQEAKRTGATFKGTINELLRRGLVNSKPQKKERFVVTPLPLDTGLGTRYPKVADLLEALEGPDYR